LVVPRNTNVCIQALLRRFCVLSPGPTLETPITEPSVAERARILSYLYERYPQGTPLDYLDIDVLFQMREGAPPVLPVLKYWRLGNVKGSNPEEGYHMSYNLVYGEASRPFFLKDTFWIFQENGFGTPPDWLMLEWTDFFAYKTTYEVRREMLLEDYYEHLASSPLEEGQIIVNSLTLRTCIDSPGTGTETQTRIETSVEPSRLIHYKPSSSVIQQYASHVKRNGARQLDQSSTINRWNTLHQEFNTYASSLKSEDSVTLSFTEPQFVRAILKHWSRFDKNDPDNHKLEDINHIFKLSDKEMEKFRKWKIITLRDLAEAILMAPKAEQLKNIMKSEQENSREQVSSQIAKLENYIKTMKLKTVPEDDRNKTEEYGKRWIENLEDLAKHIRQSQSMQEDAEFGFPITSTEADHLIELIGKRLQENTEDASDKYQKET
jgi:hypothetical protein